ncbi:peptidase inhibitor family I36 protein [Galbitalea sp. SE-J8]|uniref:peptidase inhibitor family I36 protein n=1 Tax=Galbitalea sp. SE-J8 TaxID=3054952 RepID=UPI00259C8E11|nr:peptidase inhibitor family I36 protein [Galbitalea sp. SE-J8]MDM4764403.1 peptidase inhibitor family I36 protein [Galbitalea sp. SE-J8]
MNRIKPALLAAIGALILLLIPTPASAETTTLQDQVDTILAQHPGGTQIASNAISWEDGEITLTLPAEGLIGALAVGTCETGRYCAFSGYSYTGTKLSFSACSIGGTSNSLGLLGNAPHSVANARSSGTVQARNGSTTVFSLGANSGRPTVANTVTALACLA